MANAWESAPLVNSDKQPAWASAPLVTVPRGTSESESRDTLLGKAGHYAGLANRAIVEGVTSLPDLPFRAVGGAMNVLGRINDKAVQLAGGTPNNVDYSLPLPSQGYEELNKVVPVMSQPETKGEQIALAAGRGAVSALTGAGVAGEIANTAANPVTRGAAELMASQPGLQAASGATGSAGGEIARQQGAGPGGQLAATMAAGALPAIISAGGPALIKWMLRGGEEGRQAASDVVDTFAQAGATPSVGQATGSRGYQATENLLSRVPGGAGPMVRKAEELQSNLAAKVDDMANNLAPKANPEQAGRLIERGITGKNMANPGDSFMVKSRAVQKVLYDKLDEFVPANTEVKATNTQAAIERMTAPIPGAESASQSPLLSNPTLNNLGAALETDMGWKAQSGQVSNGVTSFIAPKETMPYQALKEIRTRIGEKLSDIDLAPDVPKAQLKQLYGALSSDMEQAAKDAGPEAYKAFQRANGYTSALHDRIDLLQSVIDKNGGPEKIFNAATSGTKDGATVLRAVMKSLPEDGQKMLSASILRRMGKALPGAQNATGDVFSTERFLTAWNTMSPEAKQAAFGRYGMDFSKNMDALASIAANLRAGSKVFANPSGTAQAVSQQAVWYTTIGALLTGHFYVAAFETGLTGFANLSARALTNPKVVQWMVTTTKKPVGELPAQINLLANWAKNQNDPDAAAVAGALKQAEQSHNRANNQK